VVCFLQTWSRGAASVLAVAALMAGCSDDDEGGSGGDAGSVSDAGASSDASADCWPVETSTPAGEIEIGTGAGPFEPMPEMLPFIRGTQGGTFLIVHARLKALEPGNPDDFLDPTNPKTKFSAILADGTEVTRECPGTVGYKPSAEEGYFERQRFHTLEFLPFELGQMAFDSDVTLVAEVIDAQGRYARDERTVFAQAPEGWSDAGPSDPGDGGPGDDAAPGDAGASDAGASRATSLPVGRGAFLFEPER
jgi:hypothetical protein